jgi:hypothetical protein
MILGDLFGEPQMKMNPVRNSKVNNPANLPEQSSLVLRTPFGEASHRFPIYEFEKGGQKGLAPLYAVHRMPYGISLSGEKIHIKRTIGAFSWRERL